MLSITSFKENNNISIHHDGLDVPIYMHTHDTPHYSVIV